jgi:3-hydroxyisobutyrate dehydrogenase
VASGAAGAVGRQRTFDRLPDHFLSAKFDPPDFALRLAHEDVSLATAVLREHRVPMRMAHLALVELTEALNRGWGERDSRVAMLLQGSARVWKSRSTRLV